MEVKTNIWPVKCRAWNSGIGKLSPVKPPCEKDSRFSFSPIALFQTEIRHKNRTTTRSLGCDASDRNLLAKIRLVYLRSLAAFALATC